MPSVLLKREELAVLQTFRAAGEERSLVTIVSEDPLVRDLYYLLVQDQLWTMDQSGNPRARSCFSLEKK
jgi:hypothetical protein